MLTLQWQFIVPFYSRFFLFVGAFIVFSYGPGDTFKKKLPFGGVKLVNYSEPSSRLSK